MDEEALLKLLFEQPDAAFFLYEMGGGDYEDLKRLQIGKLFVQKKFPEISAKEYFESAEFMFWLSYFVERELTETVTEIEVAVKHLSKQEAERLISDMSFGQKIKFVVKEKYVLDEDDPYILLLWKIKELRDHMAHGRLHMLHYAGHALSHPKGQIKLTIDLANAMLKRDDTTQKAGGSFKK